MRGADDPGAPVFQKRHSPFVDGGGCGVIRRGRGIDVIGARLFLAVLLVMMATVMARADDEVADSPGAVRALEVGALVPDASALGCDGTRVRLSELLGGKRTLVVFYRGSWCPFCTSRLGELQFMRSQLGESGVDVVAVSPDRPEVLCRSRDELALRYRVLSDSNMELARAFRVAYRVSEEQRDRLARMGIDLEEASGQKHHQLPVASLFLVDTEQRVRFRYLSIHHREWLGERQILDVVTRTVAEE